MERHWGIYGIMLKPGTRKWTLVRKLGETGFEALRNVVSGHCNALRPQQLLFVATYDWKVRFCFGCNVMLLTESAQRCSQIRAGFSFHASGLIVLRTNQCLGRKGGTRRDRHDKCILFTLRDCVLLRMCADLAFFSALCLSSRRCFRRQHSALSVTAHRAVRGIGVFTLHGLLFRHPCAPGSSAITERMHLE
ncbi:hypothetical protein NDU88_001287 [Pleurodeles waltl]|uniref:Uncharacterized protein n=1 Tax=Pleurodeles waltl TaxID=8319 RepID=A0AAV7R6R1_PLEWA|nr:hypothetical protein NDU88_001287 [Pleurodeles waltl]